MIKFENMGAFLEGIDQWVDRMEELAEGVFRGMAVDAFNHVVQGTPQWSGGLASNWRLTIGAPATGYQESLFKDESSAWENSALISAYSKLRRNAAAEQYALSVAREQLPFIRLGADVFITNTAPYAAEVESNRRTRDGQAFIRPVNLPIEMTLSAAARGNKLGGISAAKALKLAGMTL